jgi:hypothetical protein
MLCVRFFGRSRQYCIASDCRTSQVQLIFGWGLVLRLSLLSSEGHAFFGISYDEKDGLVRELASERNNKLRRSCIKSGCGREVDCYQIVQ